jgi:hypothetical protein
LTSFPKSHFWLSPPRAFSFEDVFSSMKEKTPKSKRRRSMPSIHFSSQASSGKWPSTKKTAPKNRGTKACFLFGRLSLKTNKPNKGHICIQKNINIPWGIPHILFASLGDDKTPIIIESTKYQNN